MNDMDHEGTTPLRLMALSMHEVYTELKRAGFSKGEAIKVVSNIVVGMMVGQVSDE